MSLLARLELLKRDFRAGEWACLLSKYLSIFFGSTMMTKLCSRYLLDRPYICLKAVPSKAVADEIERSKADEIAKTVSLLDYRI